MRYVIWIVLALIGLAGCSRSPRQNHSLDRADSLVYTHPDSALAILNEVDASEIEEDSIKAKYHRLVALAHKVNESSMASDSLVRFSFEYYKDRDFRRFLESGDLYALHLFWSGQGKKSLELLDSMLTLPNVPDNIKIKLLQTRIGVGGAVFDCKNNIAYIKSLQALDKDSAQQLEYKYQLCENYQFAGQTDSALLMIDELIDYAYANHKGELQFQYQYEKIGILEELGKYEESNALVDYILKNAPGNTAIPYLRFWKALNYFNMGKLRESSIELAKADSCAKGGNDFDNNYYESFAGPLREFLAYRQNGRIKLSQLAALNNGQRDMFNRLESTRWETEQNVLKQENKALALKAQNNRKTAILIIVLLAAVIIGLLALWNIQKRKRKIVEADERAEALQKMVDELRVHDEQSSGQESLRRVMLQQLGIIKMVAETPTEQNREMLRKISSIDSDTNGALVNWENVYEIIDNLYSGFHSRLHQRYGDLLSDKEEQIIVLMTAGFSTKEISVITLQTTATIYVRKSSIRKKLGVPEKEDIVSFLRQPASD